MFRRYACYALVVAGVGVLIGTEPRPSAQRARRRPRIPTRPRDMREPHQGVGRASGLTHP